MNRLLLVLACVGACIAACGDDAGPAPMGFRPDVVCPGPACPEVAGGRLMVGYAKASLSPSADNMTVDPFAAFANWNDANCDDTWQSSETADLRPDGAWIAGYGEGRPALGMHDPIEARTIVMRTHGLTVSFTQLDVLGYFYDEIQKIRDLVRHNGDKVDLVLVGSSHVHEAPDVIGIWGRNVGSSGIDPRYIDFINRTAAATIHAALGRLEEATLTIGQAKTEDAGGDMQHYVSDTRDPVVIDDMLSVLLFKRPSDGKPITALVNWGAHPEGTGSRNHLISADFPHWLRDGLEQGFVRMGTAYPPLAPDVLFMQGEVGGQIGPGRVRALGDDGNPVPRCRQPQHPPGGMCPDRDHPGQFVAVTPDDCFAFPAAVGHGVATFAHKALAQGAVTLNDVPVAWRAKTFRAHVDNVRYHVAFLAGLFADTRQIYDYDRSRPIGPDNAPQVQTEEVYVMLGPASFVTLPGELLPELFVGGYHGEHSGTYPIIQPGNPNPPDLSKAPPPPYLCDLMDGDFRFALGLTADFLGYIIPSYNFVLGDSPYISEAPGDHYEETNSIGERADPELIGTMQKLLTYGKPSLPVSNGCPGR